ncbi:MAG: C_GCAxxG_C_C family protein [Anaerolineae bacterium]|nr:C_GCAxxG_C_C family protein [Anaerolineae bacterium]
MLDPFPDVCRRIGTGFSGGLGGTHQELCGALSGGVIVTSALLGRSNLSGDDHPAMNVATLYWARFVARYGDARCAPVRERVHAEGGLGSCGALVEEATKTLLEILNEMPYPAP